MKFIIYTFIISLFLFISCDPCEEIDCPNPFTDEELQWLPYSKGDKLVFIDLNSSTRTTYSINETSNGQFNISDEGSPYCRTDCLYFFHASGKGNFSDEEDTFTFEMVNTINELDLNIYIGSYNYYYLNGGKPGSCLFNLGRADHLDSLLVNGNYLKDVYKYLTSPKQEIVAETYLHQGKGLVKIIFRNGQELDLVEHIKSNN